MGQNAPRVTYIVNARLPGGGVGNVAYYQAQAAADAGYLGRLIANSFRDRSFAHSDTRQLGLPGRALKRLAIYDSSQRIYAFEDWLFDKYASHVLASCNIAHGWLLHSYYALMGAKRRGALAVLQTGSTHPLAQAQLLDNEYRRWGIPFHYPLRRHVLDEIAHADYVLVSSTFAAETFVEHGVSRERIVLIPWGVNVERFTPRPGGRTDDIFRVIFVGQVSIRKGIMDLLDAWRQFSNPRSELIVIGRADPPTQQLLARRTMPERVHWLQHSSALWEWYHQSDLFVFPTVEEGSALVTYEAMACGLPVVTTPNAGSLVRDGVDGFIIQPHDTGALVEHITWIHEHPSEREAMGRSARTGIEPMTWKRHGRRLIEFYEQIIRQS
jgi:glycosyltransferase involved in cell wall biosynthesis